MRSSAKRPRAQALQPPLTSSSTEQPGAHSRGLGIDALPRRVRTPQPSACGHHCGGPRAGPGRAQRTGETTSERHRAMTWMQRLKRVFKIDVHKSAG
jgi:hypothetical protein